MKFYNSTNKRGTNRKMAFKNLKILKKYLFFTSCMQFKAHVQKVE